MCMMVDMHCIQYSCSFWWPWLWKHLKGSSCLLFCEEHTNNVISMLSGCDVVFDCEFMKTSSVSWEAPRLPQGCCLWFPDGCCPWTPHRCKNCPWTPWGVFAGSHTPAFQSLTLTPPLWLGRQWLKVVGFFFPVEVFWLWTGWKFKVLTLTQ